MLQANYDPYAKGRWYRIFMESDGTTSQITEADLECSMHGKNIEMPAGFRVVDAKYDINNVEHDAAVTLTIDRIGYANGNQGIAGPEAKAFDYAYIYVFGYFK